jgi:tetratricopeptide (TPR) repeat protein
LDKFLIYPSLDFKPSFFYRIFENVRMFLHQCSLCPRPNLTRVYADGYKYQSNLNWFVIFVQSVLILFVLGCFGSTYAQINCNDKAIHKSFLQARDNKYTKAIKTLENTLPQYSNCATTYTRLSELYYRINNINAAAKSIQVLLKINEQEGEFALNYILSLMAKYKENNKAIDFLKSIQRANGLSSNTNVKLQSRIDEMSYTMNMQNEGKGNIPRLASDSINLAHNQNYPSLTLDEKKMVFTYLENGANEQIYYTTFDSCLGWRKAKALPDPPNTSFPEGTPRLSPDGYYLLITRCDLRSVNGWDGGGCDLLLFYKENESTWSSPQKFGSTINSPGYEGQGCLNSENNRIYFASNRDGGFGGMDIWRTDLVNGLWQKPINLGPQINTKGNEEAPLIHSDNHTFYFSSNGHKTIGGFDLFRSEIIADTQFSSAVNLGYPINTDADEQSIFVGANGSNAWISRNSVFDKGAYNIYNVQLDGKNRAQPVICVQGQVRNKFTKDLMKGIKLNLKDQNGNLLKIYRSNEGDASFSISILGSLEYQLEPQVADDFKPATYLLNTKENKLMTGNYVMPILLKEIGIVDTLLQQSYQDSIGKDTLLGLIINDFCFSKTNEKDSLKIFLDFTENDFVDTTFKNQVCFSDSGIVEYENFIQKIKVDREKSNQLYLDAYLKNIKSKNKDIGLIPRRFKQTWITKGLYKIDIIVVEYY